MDELRERERREVRAENGVRLIHPSVSLFVLFADSWMQDPLLVLIADCCYCLSYQPASP